MWSLTVLGPSSEYDPIERRRRTATVLIIEDSIIEKDYINKLRFTDSDNMATGPVDAVITELLTSEISRYTTFVQQ